MSAISVQSAHPSLLSRLLSSLVFHPWQRRRRVDVRDLSPHLRRDIGLDD